MQKDCDKGFKEISVIIIKISISLEMEDKSKTIFNLARSMKNIIFKGSLNSHFAKPHSVYLPVVTIGHTTSLSYSNQRGIFLHFTWKPLVISFSPISWLHHIFFLTSHISLLYIIDFYFLPAAVGSWLFLQNIS